MVLISAFNIILKGKPLYTFFSSKHHQPKKEANMRFKFRSLPLVLVFLLLALVMPFASAADGCLFYFTAIDCQDCQNTDYFVSQVSSRYEGLQVETFEVYQNRQNAKMITHYFDSYKVPEGSRGIPAVFFKNSYLIGADSINNLLDGYIKDNAGLDCPSLIAHSTIGVAGEKEPHDVLDTLGLVLVTSSGLKDGFRLGMIALLLVFIALLLLFKDEVKLVEKGVMFIAGVFGVYFIFIFGWFSWFATGKVGFFFIKIIGVSAIILSLVTIKGFFSTVKVLSRKVPESKKALQDKLFRIFFSSFAMPIYGFVFGLFTFTHLDNPFLVLRVLLSEIGFRFIAIPLSVYYIFLMLIPLILTLIIFRLVLLRIKSYSQLKNPYDDNKAEKLKLHQHKLMNLTVSLILLVLGLYLLFA
jgi:hypothetical protein